MIIKAKLNIGLTKPRYSGVVKMLKTIEKPQEVQVPEITEKYPKQWVTLEVTKRDKYGFPASGRVLYQATDRDLMLDKTKYIKGDLYIFYTGSIDDEPQ